MEKSLNPNKVVNAPIATPSNERPNQQSLRKYPSNIWLWYFFLTIFLFSSIHNNPITMDTIDHMYSKENLRHWHHWSKRNAFWDSLWLSGREQVAFFWRFAIKSFCIPNALKYVYERWILMLVISHFCLPSSWLSLRNGPFTERSTRHPLFLCLCYHVYCQLYNPFDICNLCKLEHTHLNNAPSFDHFLPLG